MASQEFDPDSPLPYGGITDIHGNIVKAFTKESKTRCLPRRGEPLEGSDD